MYMRPALGFKVLIGIIASLFLATVRPLALFTLVVGAIIGVDASLYWGADLFLSFGILIGTCTYYYLTRISADLVIADAAHFLDDAFDMCTIDAEDMAKDNDLLSNLITRRNIATEIGAHETAAIITTKIEHVLQGGLAQQSSGPATAAAIDAGFGIVRGYFGILTSTITFGYAFVMYTLGIRTPSLLARIVVGAANSVRRVHPMYFIYFARNVISGLTRMVYHDDFGLSAIDELSQARRYIPMSTREVWFSSTRIMHNFTGVLVPVDAFVCWRPKIVAGTSRADCLLAALAPSTSVYCNNVVVFLRERPAAGFSSLASVPPSVTVDGVRPHHLPEGSSLDAIPLAADDVVEGLNVRADGPVNSPPGPFMVVHPPLVVAPPAPVPHPSVRGPFEEFFDGGWDTTLVDFCSFGYTAWAALCMPGIPLLIGPAIFASYRAVRSHVRVDTQKGRYVAAGLLVLSLATYATLIFKHHSKKDTKSPPAPTPVVVLPSIRPLPRVSPLTMRELTGISSTPTSSPIKIGSVTIAKPTVREVVDKIVPEGKGKTKGGRGAIKTKLVAINTTKKNSDSKFWEHVYARMGELKTTNITDALKTGMSKGHTHIGRNFGALAKTYNPDVDQVTTLSSGVAKITFSEDFTNRAAVAQGKDAVWNWLNNSRVNADPQTISAASDEIEGQSFQRGASFLQTSLDAMLRGETTDATSLFNVTNAESCTFSVFISDGMYHIGTGANVVARIPVSSVNVDVREEAQFIPIIIGLACIAFGVRSDFAEIFIPLVNGRPSSCFLNGSRRITTAFVGLGASASVPATSQEAAEATSAPVATSSKPGLAKIAEKFTNLFHKKSTPPSVDVDASPLAPDPSPAPGPDPSVSLAESAPLDQGSSSSSAETPSPFVYSSDEDTSAFYSSSEEYEQGEWFETEHGFFSTIKTPSGDEYLINEQGDQFTIDRSASVEVDIPDTPSYDYSPDASVSDETIPDPSPAPSPDSSNANDSPLTEESSAPDKDTPVLTADTIVTVGPLPKTVVHSVIDTDLSAPGGIPARIDLVFRDFNTTKGKLYSGKGPYVSFSPNGVSLTDAISPYIHADSLVAAQKHLLTFPMTRIFGHFGKKVIRVSVPNHQDMETITGPANEVASYLDKVGYKASKVYLHCCRFYQRVPESRPASRAATRGIVLTKVLKHLQSCVDHTVAELALLPVPESFMSGSANNPIYFVDNVYGDQKQTGRCVKVGLFYFVNQHCVITKPTMLINGEHVPLRFIASTGAWVENAMDAQIISAFSTRASDVIVCVPFKKSVPLVTAGKGIHFSKVAYPRGTSYFIHTPTITTRMPGKVIGGQIHYHVTTNVGDCGSPVFCLVSGEFLLCALHHYGGADSNSADIIVPSILNDLLAKNSMLSASPASSASRAGGC